jgi:DNA polymerase elongation subunit (family B)
MLIDFEYKSGSLMASYLDPKGKFRMKYYPWRKPKKYVKTVQDDPDKSEYHTWDGEAVKVVNCKIPNRYSVFEFFDALEQKEREEIFGYVEPKQIAFIDIENEILPGGWSPPQKAAAPILTVSIVVGSKVMLLGLKPMGNGQINNIKKKLDKHFENFNLNFDVKYISFHDNEDPERALVAYLLEQVIPNFSIITGWNFVEYDWVYIINRARKLGLDPSSVSPSRLLDKPFNKEPSAADKKKKLKKKYEELPRHRVIVDYMDLYKKWDTSIKVKESAALDFVSMKLLGVGKIKYPGDLQQLYDENLEEYLFYNAADSILVQLIHEKTKYANIMFAIASLAKVRILDAVTTLRVTEGILREDYRDKLNIVFFKDYDDSHIEEKIKGGYVKNPLKGMNRYVSCYDFASLYPTNIRQFNLSPETFRGYVIKDEPGYALWKGKKYKIAEDDIVAVNNAVFARSESVVVNKLTEIYYDRKKNKKWATESKDKAKTYSDQMKAEKSKLKPDKELMAELKVKYEEAMASYNRFDAIQMALKLVLNGSYGAFAARHFVAFENGVASTITAFGRDIIQVMGTANEDYWHNKWHLDTELHKILGVTDVKQIPKKTSCTVYIDTDSNYITFYPGAQSCGWNEDPIKFVHTVNNHRLAGYFVDVLEAYADKYKVKNIEEFELESISESIIFLEKKKYIKNLAWEDGEERTENPDWCKKGIFHASLSKLSPTGIDIVSSKTPLFVREHMDGIIKYYFINKDDLNDFELNKLLKKIKMAHEVADIEDISCSTSVNDMGAIIDDQANFLYEKGATHNVKAAGFYNYLLNKNSTLKNKYNLIQAGDKIKYYYAKSVTKLKGTKEFAYIRGSYPIEFAEREAPIDRDLTFEKTILSLVNRFNAVLGLSQFDRNLQMRLDIFNTTKDMKKKVLENAKTSVINKWGDDEKTIKINADNEAILNDDKEWDF